MTTMKRKQTPEPEPQPRGFKHLAHFEQLRHIQRKRPAQYMTMSAHAKAQLELYLLMRRAACPFESKQEKRKRKRAALENFCRCCGESIFITLDHIVPKSQGGSNQVENLQPLCPTCNMAKKENSHCPHEQIVRALIWQHIEPEAISA
jgi:5-methylcytosine-specific restriction endonuclease McrA